MIFLLDHYSPMWNHFYKKIEKVLPTLLEHLSDISRFGAFVLTDEKRKERMKMLKTLSYRLG